MVSSRRSHPQWRIGSFARLTNYCLQFPIATRKACRSTSIVESDARIIFREEDGRKAKVPARYAVSPYAQAAKDIHILAKALLRMQLQNRQARQEEKALSGGWRLHRDCMESRSMKGVFTRHGD